MNKQQQHKLRKHPFIRFIRGIFRLMRAILDSSKNTAGQERDRIERARIRQAAIDSAEMQRAEIERAEIERTEIERVEQEKANILAAQARELADKYITVGDLFGRVQWKVSSQSDLQLTSATKVDVRPLDFSQN